jgi:hypothetical protein
VDGRWSLDPDALDTVRRRDKWAADGKSFLSLKKFIAILGVIQCHNTRKADIRVAWLHVEILGLALQPLEVLDTQSFGIAIVIMAATIS